MIVFLIIFLYRDFPTSDTYISPKHEIKNKSFSKFFKSPLVKSSSFMGHFSAPKLVRSLFSTQPAQIAYKKI